MAKRTACMLLPLIFWVFVFWGVSSCEGKRRKADLVQASQETPDFRLPEIPAMLTGATERADYVAAHFWDAYDEQSALGAGVKRKYLDQLAAIDAAKLEETLVSLPDTVTPMDMKYIVCFMAGIDLQDISTMFSIEPASVYTVRYRIRRKLGDGTLSEFLI